MRDDPPAIYEVTGIPIELDPVRKSGRIKLKEGMNPNGGGDRGEAGHGRDPDEIQARVHGSFGAPRSF